jgi:hypothetical protein
MLLRATLEILRVLRLPSKRMTVAGGRSGCACIQSTAVRRECLHCGDNVMIKCRLQHTPYTNLSEQVDSVNYHSTKKRLGPCSMSARQPAVSVAYRVSGYELCTTRYANHHLLLSGCTKYSELNDSASHFLTGLFSRNLACIRVPLSSPAITIPSEPILSDLNVETVISIFPKKLSP